MLIKVCGMREAENISALQQEVNPDLMGLIFYPKSSRYVETPQPIMSKLTILKVGVFVNATEEELLATAEKYQLAYLQLHGDEPVELLRSLKARSRVKLIKVFRVSGAVDWRALEAYESYVDYFLFDTQTKAYGGSGHQFDWSVLEDYPLKKPFLLSGGIDTASIPDLVSFSKKSPMMAGVDINSKFEDNPALKNIPELKRFKASLLEALGERE